MLGKYELCLYVCPKSLEEAMIDCEKVIRSLTFPVIPEI